MGLFRKLKKAIKKVAKVAIKTAPVWSSFIPGGSALGQVISKVAPIAQKVQSFRGGLRAVGKPGSMRKGVFQGPGARGSPTWMTAENILKRDRSYQEESMREAPGVVHAGITGPVPTMGWGAHRLSPMMLLRGRGQARPRPRRPRRRRPLRFAGDRVRTRTGQFSARRGRVRRRRRSRAA